MLRLVGDRTRGEGISEEGRRRPAEQRRPGGGPSAEREAGGGLGPGPLLQKDGGSTELAAPSWAGRALATCRWAALAAASAVSLARGRVRIGCALVTWAASRSSE